MIVLIVDDQIHVAKGVENGIDWAALGVDKVLLTFSMSEAQHALNNYPIDIVISDIEMPMGSGLDLISWVRENYPQVTCIFLTSHEDFEYARTAIKLGSFDYLIQPIEYDELARVIAQAIESIQVRATQDELSEMGRCWQDQAQNVRENLWASILTGSYDTNSAKLDDQADQLGLAIRPPVRFLPMLIDIHRRKIQLSAWDDDLLKSTFINVLEEILYDRHDMIEVTQLDATHYVFLLPQSELPEVNDMLLFQKMKFFQNFCQTQLKMSLAVYIGEHAPVDKLAAVYDRLVALERTNVASYSKVFSLSNEADSTVHAVETAEIAHWSKLLDQGLVERVREEIKAYFGKKVASEAVSAAFLARFQSEFLQMIWQLSESKGVKNLDMLFSKQVIDHFLASLDTVEDMLAFVENVITIPLEPTMSDQDYISTIEKVKAYIDENLDRELSRNEIADRVFLNPEYLSRLFRKKTGQSLTEYITSQRVGAAIGLLVKTSMPVSIIASKVGYSNFSHFSKIFKKTTGKTPNEYRKSHAGQTDNQ